MATDVVLSGEELEKLLTLKREDCENKAKDDDSSKLTCSRIWDGIMCWPPTHPRQLYTQQCPLYIPGFDRVANATKECTENGTWFVSPTTQKMWTNYSQCYTSNETMIAVPVAAFNTSVFQDYLPVLKTISHVGYGVSLLTLVIAFIILVTLNFMVAALAHRERSPYERASLNHFTVYSNISFLLRLHCSRNMLHLHLFMSFIMKAVITFAKEFLFEQGVGLHSDFIVKNGTSYFVENMNRNWECKVVTTIWQYFIMANYSWVFMEGLYIHNVIIFALFSDDSSIFIYIILGWGLPMVFVALWVFAQIQLNNELCWTTNTDSKNFLIIRIPIIVSISLSFVLFVNIVRLLLTKVRSTVQEETQRYWKLAKSTLILIPLFGVHYAVFHGMSYSRGVNEKLELVWLFCDLFFASFQGFFVAVLFCFLNAEIQTELKRKWRRLSCHGNGNQGRMKTPFLSLPIPCITSICGDFTFGRYHASAPRSDSRASKRTDTLEFMTNDSVIPMIVLEKPSTSAMGGVNTIAD